MAWAAWPDLSVEISRRRWRCVADPHLCLSQHGAAFLHGLAAHAEVWLGPEFLSILDSWMLYDGEPELLIDAKTRDRHGALGDANDLRHALQLWLRARDDPGLGAAQLCWIRDAVRESCLPAGLDDSVVPRWEAMTEALDERLSISDEPNGPLVAAARDAAALAGLLPGAVLLTLCDPDEQPCKPALCRHLEAWHLPCRKLPFGDDLVVMERTMLQQTLIDAGLAGFMWGGMRLAVVHLEVPGKARIPLTQLDLDQSADETELIMTTAPRQMRGVWEDARAFWYELIPEDRDARI